MNDHHDDGTSHRFEFVSFLNQFYSGTALLHQDALMICPSCGAWRIVPQNQTEEITP